MEAFAVSPLERVRTAIMTSWALRRTKCFAASKPRPVFEPVTMMVWPVKELVGYGSLTKSWE